MPEVGERGTVSSLLEQSLRVVGWVTGQLCRGVILVRQSEMVQHPPSVRENHPRGSILYGLRIWRSGSPRRSSPALLRFSLLSISMDYYRSDRSKTNYTIRAISHDRFQFLRRNVRSVQEFRRDIRFQRISRSFSVIWKFWRICILYDRCCSHISITWINLLEYYSV